MLTVNQKERWTAKQLLQHPWITEDSNKLASKNLASSVVALKKYNIRRKFKAAADAVMISNRIGKMLNFRKVEIDDKAVKESDLVSVEELKEHTPTDFK